MIHVRQHIPAYVDGVKKQDDTVATLNELLALPWIARWDESYPEHDVTNLVFEPPDWKPKRVVRHVKAQTFHRWSIARHDGDDTLMVEYNNGDDYRVVAYLKSDEPIDLPDWQENEVAR